MHIARHRILKVWPCRDGGLRSASVEIASAVCTCTRRSRESPTPSATVEIARHGDLEEVALHAASAETLFGAGRNIVLGRAVSNQRTSLMSCPQTHAKAQTKQTPIPNRRTDVRTVLFVPNAIGHTRIAAPARAAGVGGAFPSVEGRVSLYTCIVYVFRMYLA